MIRFRNLTLAVLATLAAPPAFAQEANDTAATETYQSSTGNTASKRFAVVGGYALSEPSNSPGTVAGAASDFNGDGATTLGASWYITDNIAVEAWGAADKFGHRMKLDGRKAGSVSAQPYAVSGQYHFREAGSTVRPFVGLGYYEMNIDEERAAPTGALAGQRIGMTSPKGAIATAGLDLNITPTWFARTDVRYLHGTSDVELNRNTPAAVNAGEVKLNPIVFGVGVGARF